MPYDAPPQSFGDLREDAASDQIFVILVETQDGRNIGAVARAMSNLGFSKLRLVNPASFDEKIARGVACWGEELIASAERFTSLEDAVRDLNEVVGFASDSGRHRVSQMLLDDWVDSLEGDTQRRIALVFGSEDNGLGKDHFPLCQYLVRIPSTSENRSYNLAQSVLLALYTLRMKQTDVVGEGVTDWPTSSQFEGFTQMVLQVASTAGFLNEHSPSHMKDLLTNLTRRGRLTTRELKILTGLFGKISKCL